MESAILERLDTLKEDVAEIKKSQTGLYKTLNGNGHAGLITKQALQSASLFRLWAAVWVMIVGFFGFAFYIYHCGVSQVLK